MPTEINLLMDIDPLDLSEQNLDEIIAYHRANRAKEVGGKLKKPKPEGGVDLTEVMAKLIAKNKAEGEALKAEAEPKPMIGGLRRI